GGDGSVSGDETDRPIPLAAVLDEVDRKRLRCRSAEFALSGFDGGDENERRKGTGSRGDPAHENLRTFIASVFGPEPTKSRAIFVRFVVDNAQVGARGTSRPLATSGIQTFRERSTLLSCGRGRGTAYLGRNRRMVLPKRNVRIARCVEWRTFGSAAYR